MDLKNDKIITGFSQRTWRKQPLESLSHGWKDNIKMGPKEIMHDIVEWINLTQERVWSWAVVNMVIDFELHKRDRGCFD
jgi:hypothetical protein